MNNFLVCLKATVQECSVKRNIYYFREASKKSLQQIKMLPQGVVFYIFFVNLRNSETQNLNIIMSLDKVELAEVEEDDFVVCEV